MMADVPGLWRRFGHLLPLPASAATVLPAVVESKGYTNLHALPRVAWDGRQRSLRMMRVILSGVFLPQLKAKRTDWS